MGRTQSEVSIDILQKKIDTYEAYKKRLIKHAQEIEQKFVNDELSYPEYLQLLHRKIDGKTIHEWFHHCNLHIKHHKKHLHYHKKAKQKESYKNIGYVILILGIIFSAFYPGPSITGFFVSERIETYSETVGIEFTETTDYVLEVGDLGNLKSARISGIVEGEGRVRVYLDDLLIADSDKLIIESEFSIPESAPEITGFTVDESYSEVAPQSPSQEAEARSDGGGSSGGTAQSEEPTPSDTPEPEPAEEVEFELPEEDVVEEPPIEEDTPPEEVVEEEPVVEENITEEEVEEPVPEPTPEPVPEPTPEPELAPEPSPEPEQNVTTREFKDVCEETCDLGGLGLNKTSYTIRIEIFDATLKLDEIKYELTLEEEVEEPVVEENVTEPVEENITEPIIKNITVENVTNITQENITELILPNVTEANFTETETQYDIVIGEPVRWKKTISLDDPGVVKTRLTKYASNITINKILDESYSEETLEVAPQSPSPEEPSSAIFESIETRKITKQRAHSVIRDLVTDEEIEDNRVSPIVGFFARAITGNAVKEDFESIEVVIDDNATEYEIEYYTDAPQVAEEELSHGKRITVFAPDELGYTNILAYTELPSEAPANAVRLYHLVDGTRTPVEINKHDRNGNELVDYIEWVVPHLSNQTYELIIEITKAEHLDGNRSFVEDIYEQVKHRDNNWSSIPDGHYVRVVFEENLTNERDITIYAKSSDSAKIEVYEKDSDVKVADFGSISTDNKYKVYLTGLVSESQDTFDLKIVGGTIEIDHIVDPYSVLETGMVVTDGWTVVNTVRSYTTPVVVAFPSQGYEVSADMEVAAAVVENVTSSSFEVQLYTDDGSVIAGNISYIVVENGSHILSNGMLMQAGLVTGVDYYDANSDSASAYKSITFHTAYDSAPAVIASPNQDSHGGWITVRYDVGSLSTSGISISLEIDQTHGNAPVVASPTNTIAWIALNRTSAADMEAGLEVDVDEDPGTGDWRALSFSNLYTTPLFFGLGEEDTGTDPTLVGFQNLGPTGVDIRRTEERTDSEQSHATEDTLWMVFESGLGNVPPTTPTEIECDGSSDCNIVVDASVEVNASGSTDDDGDAITYLVEASLLNSTISEDQESGTQQAIATGGGTPLGETGSVNISDHTSVTVEFQNSYSSTPLVIATPVTQNGDTGDDDSSLIPVIESINTTHIEFNICQDNGASTCDSTVNQETIHYFVFDVDAELPSWMVIGTQSTTPNGADTAITFGKTFSNVPYVFTQSQTNNQGSNIAAIAWVDDITTSGANLLGCTHQGIADACDSSTPSETMGWVAIDVANAAFGGSVNFQSGSADISNSDWTAASWTANYTNARMMVTQNDDDGGQDPQYAWARDVDTSTPDFRYCEQDAADVCHSHTSEFVMWFTMEQGDITLSGSTNDEEAVKDWETYNNILSNDWNNITDQINVTVYVSEYDKSGSTQNGNNAPDLELEMYNGSSFVGIGNFSVSASGNFTLTTSDSSILTAWQGLSNSSLRIRGVDFDYYDASNIDEINYTDVWVASIGAQWILLGNHTNTTTITWDTSGLEEQNCVELRARASDVDGSGGYSGYLTKGACLNISHAAANTAPEITFVSPIADTNPVEASSTTVTFYATMYDEDGVADLNDNSVNASFTRTGETARYDTGCTRVGDIDANSANYSCSIDMWYFDGAGSWDITVYGEDDEPESATNSSESFTYNQLQAIVISPASISFDAGTGDTNVLADDHPTQINNTGNYNATGNLAIEAYDLFSGSNILGSGNFTAGVNVGAVCASGDTMENATNTTITSLVLEKGNLSVGEAQEDVYYCIAEVPQIVSGTYDTSGSDSWIIRLLAGAAIPASLVNKKKKRRPRRNLNALKLINDLGKEYSLDREEVIEILGFVEKLRRKYGISRSEIAKLAAPKELKIPVTIFLNKVGGLEAVCKYMKDQLHMNYHEISTVLKRDERTIWSAYKKATEKKAKLEIKKTDIFIPSSIFSKKLTILESTIAHLKDKGLKYSEIGRLLNRDQRNIWSTYSKVVKTKKNLKESDD